jgi:ribosomal 50S subunit-recycling heat shock protein
MSMNSFHSRSGRVAPKVEHKPAEKRRPAGMQRADVLLVTQKHVESRTRARQLIEAGRVCSDIGPITKPGQMLPESAVLTVLGDVQNQRQARISDPDTPHSS